MAGPSPAESIWTALPLISCPACLCLACCSSPQDTQQPCWGAGTAPYPGRLQGAAQPRQLLAAGGTRIISSLLKFK